MFEVDLNVLPEGVRRALEAARPKVALVLGSGFAGLASAVDVECSVRYADIEAYPRPYGAVLGHTGELLVGRASGVPVLVFCGRVHCYQGVSSLDAAMPARLSSAAGCGTLIVTNAAGGVNERLSAGDVVLIGDQINLTGSSPLVGWPGPGGGVPFVPMRDAYDPALRALVREVAGQQSMALVDGVYAGLLGPAFETPAEVRYLRAIGADVVGMSTVPEVIAARALGMRVLGFSLVTNAAAGIDLTHQEVLETGKAATERLTRLLLAILQRL